MKSDVLTRQTLKKQITILQIKNPEKCLLYFYRIFKYIRISFKLSKYKINNYNYDVVYSC